MKDFGSFFDWMFKAKLNERATQMRFLRFLLSGLTVFAVQAGTLAALSFRWGSLIAFGGSYLAALSVHYSLNKFWALRSGRTDLARQTGEYIALGLFSFLANYCLYYAAIHWLGLSPVWALVVTNLPMTIAMFLVLNFRVFRE